MNTENRLRAIIDGFAFSGELMECREVITGHINRTYHLTFRQPDGTRREYVLQNINTYAFRQPEQLMENIRKVTEHLRGAMLARGQNPENRVLRVVAVKGGGSMLLDGDGGCWRAYDYILNSTSVNQVSSPAQFREIGSAFGEFQTMLADFPIDQLYDTIPDFHNTRKRYDAFEAAVARDVAGRVAEAREEIAFIRARKEAMGRIVDMIEAGEIPLRVTHNDTKINNVMLDMDTGKALCVIDLDTVMAGSALYDFGDAVRYGASTAAEDEPDLSRVGLDMELFRSFCEGFIAQTATRLTDAELNNLPLGVMVMTYEVGMRFLTDHLEGDVYFRIEYPGHNLVRARNQMRLLADAEAHEEDMYRIVRELVRKYRET